MSAFSLTANGSDECWIKPATNILITRMAALTRGNKPSINNPAQINSAKVDKIRLRFCPSPIGSAKFTLPASRFCNFNKPCPKNINAPGNPRKINNPMSFKFLPFYFFYLTSFNLKFFSQKGNRNNSLINQLCL